MTNSSDIFIPMINDYMNKKLHKKDRKDIYLHNSYKFYENDLSVFYKYLIELNLYDIILLHYINITRYGDKVEQRHFEADEKVLDAITIFNAYTSQEESLLSFCKNFVSTYKDTYENTKDFTTGVCCYISKNIYGIDLPLSEQPEYLNNKQNFGRIVDAVTVNIKNKLQKKNTTYNWWQPIDEDGKVSQILPCALYMYANTVYTLSINLSDAYEGFLWVYEEYVLPNFNKCSLLTNENTRNTIITYMFRNYYDVLGAALHPYEVLIKNFEEYTLPIGTTHKFWFEGELVYNEDITYDEENLYEEAMVSNKSKQKYLNEELISYSKKYKKLFNLFLKCISKASFEAYKIEEGNAFSHILTQCIIGLYFSGDKDSARKYLIQYYNNIGVNEKKLNLFFVFLVRCIMECDDYEIASVLLSLYVRDYTQPFEKNVISLTKQMAEDLFMAQMVAEREYKLDKVAQVLNKTLIERVYRNKELAHLIMSANGVSSNNKPLYKHEFYVLKRVYEQFSSNVINLGILRQDLFWDYQYFNQVCEENHHYDKIPNSKNVRTFFLDKYISKRDELACELYYSGKSDASKLVGYELQEHIYSLQIKAIIEENIKLKKEKDKIANGLTDEELNECFHEIEKKCELFNRALMNISGKPCLEKYVAIINNSQSTFLKNYTNSKNTWKKLSSQKLPNKIESEFMEYLTTSYIIYNVLCEAYDHSQKIDFSPACLSLTKALEMVLGYIWDIAKKQITVDSIPDNCKTYYCYVDKKADNQYKFKSSLELGTYARMFEEKWFKQAVEKTKIIDFNKLNEMKACFYTDIKLPVKNKAPCVFIKGANDKNISTISSALLFVTNEYRNKIAHKTLFKKTFADECRNYLISAQQLLWILLYIMKDASDNK